MSRSFTQMYVLCVALTVGMGTSQTSTPSDKLNAEQEYQKAMQSAKDAADALNEKVTLLNTTAKDDASIASLGQKMLGQTGRTTPTEEDIRHVHQVSRQRQHHIRQLTDHARELARSIEDWARKAEEESQKTGVSEHEARKTERTREDYSRHLENEVQKSGDKGQRLIQHIYGRIKEHFEEQRKAARKAAERSSPQNLAEVALLNTPQQGQSLAAQSHLPSPLDAAALVVVCISFGMLAAKIRTSFRTPAIESESAYHLLA